MASSISELLMHLTFRADTKDLRELTSHLKQLEANIKSTGYPTTKMTTDLNSLERQVRQTASANMQMGREVSNLGTKLSLLVTLPVVLFFKSATEAAMNYEVQIRKTDIVFGQYADNVHANAKKAAGALGMSAATYERTIGSLGTTFSEYGVSQQQSFSLSTALAKREADIAAFNGASVDDVSQAVQVAMAGGRTLALRKLLVSFSTADVTKEAEKLGLAGGGLSGPKYGSTSSGGITDASRSIATAQLILERSQLMEGSLDKQRGTTIGKLRTEKAEFENLKVSIGEQLLPTLGHLLSAGNNLITMFNSMPAGVQGTVVAMLALAALAGPVLKVAGALMQVRTAAIAASAAGESGLLGRLGGMIVGRVGGSAAVGAAAGIGEMGAVEAGWYGTVMGGGAAAAGGVGALGVLAPLAAVAGVVGYLSWRDAATNNARKKRAQAGVAAGVGPIGDDVVTVTAQLASTRQQREVLAGNLASIKAAEKHVTDGDVWRSLEEQRKMAVALNDAYGESADKLTVQLQTLEAQQKAADDEIGYTAAVRARVTAYDDLGKTAAGVGKILQTSMTGFDVVAAQAKLQSDQASVQAELRKDPTWLTSLRGIDTGKNIASDVSTIIQAEMQAGMFRGQGNDVILKAARDLFSQESGKIGITPSSAGVASFMKDLQDSIDASGTPIVVPVTAVPYRSGVPKAFGGDLIDSLVRDIQRNQERATSP